MEKKENELAIIKPTIKVRKEFQEKQKKIISKKPRSSKVKKEAQEKRMNMKKFLEIITQTAIFVVISPILLPIYVLSIILSIILIVFLGIPFYIFYSVMLIKSNYKREH